VGNILFTGSKSIGVWDLDSLRDVSALDPVDATRQLRAASREQFEIAPSGLRLNGLTFRPVSFKPQADVIGGELLPEWEALLGCGPAYGTPCGEYDSNADARTAEGNFWDPVLGNSEAARTALRVGRIDEAGGGIDLMNANPEVLMQDWVLLKALSPGKLVGTAQREVGGPIEWLSGISISGSSDKLARSPQLSAEALSEVSRGKASLVDQLTARRDYIRQVRRLQSEEALLRPLGGSDGWIEPFPWTVNEEELANGRLVWNIADQTKWDPRCDPALHDVGSGGRYGGGRYDYTAEEVAACQRVFSTWSPHRPLDHLVLNDPTDPTNPANDFLIDFLDPNADLTDPTADIIDEKALTHLLDIADNCVPFISAADTTPPQLVAGGKFDRGCTALESLSTNVERFFTAGTIVGGDGHFDPPETFDELRRMLDANYSNDGGGDPIAGPDGIFDRNFDVFPDPIVEVDLKVSLDRAGSNFPDSTEYLYVLPDLHDPDVVAELETLGFDFEDDGSLTDPVGFFDAYFDGSSPERPSKFDCPFVRCKLKVAEQEYVRLRGEPPEIFSLVAVMPFSETSGVPVDSQGRPVGEPYQLNLANLAYSDPVGLATVLAGEPVWRDDVRTGAVDASGQPIETGGWVALAPGTLEAYFPTTNHASAINWDGDGTARGDQDGVSDFDENGDGVWDGADDFTPGPVSDDSILCGTGLPGDFFQNAAQFAPYNSVELEKMFAAFPDGLPARSPLDCASVVGLIGSTTQTLPFKRAGGDGTFGRRTFAWHGGQQVALRYQKTNVLGFSLDFAEDYTKTSWGVEFSWMSNHLFGNTKTVSGLSEMDQYVMSVSIDRPTFFNYLNPNRSFFLNTQFFVRYFTNYEGGSRNRDGNYGVADGPWSGTVTFSLFTGYFQDRLNPRATLVWETGVNGGAALIGVGYRFSGNFSAAVGYNSFWGDGPTVQRAYFPASGGYGDNNHYGAGNRGFSAVTNREELSVNLRYAW
jgi:hypothetical protein